MYSVEKGNPALLLLRSLGEGQEGQPGWKEEEAERSGKTITTTRKQSKQTNHYGQMLEIVDVEGI